MNLNGENVRWFYEFPRPVLIVEVRNTVGERLQVWQNGDWSMPCNQWLRRIGLT